jgi:purine-cytosine permease-like protein
MRPMSAGPFPVATAVTGAVLLVVLLVGVAAGRAKTRWTLLAAGIVVIVAVGIVLTAVSGGPATEEPGAELTALYTVTVPLVVSYAAGWLAVRGTWLRRFLVVGVAALLLAAFPYAAAGQATADAFLGG